MCSSGDSNGCRVALVFCHQRSSQPSRGRAEGFITLLGHFLDNSMCTDIIKRFICLKNCTYAVCACHSLFMMHNNTSYACPLSQSLCRITYRTYKFPANRVKYKATTNFSFTCIRKVRILGHFNYKGPGVTKFRVAPSQPINKWPDLDFRGHGALQFRRPHPNQKIKGRIYNRKSGVNKKTMKCALCGAMA